MNFTFKWEDQQGTLEWWKMTYEPIWRMKKTSSDRREWSAEILGGCSENVWFLWSSCLAIFDYNLVPSWMRLSCVDCAGSKPETHVVCGFVPLGRRRLAGVNGFHGASRHFFYLRISMFSIVVTYKLQTSNWSNLRILEAKTGRVPPKLNRFRRKLTQFVSPVTFLLRLTERADFRELTWPGWPGWVAEERQIQMECQGREWIRNKFCSIYRLI